MSKHTHPNGNIGTAQTGWSDVILICKKCSKKLNGGFGCGRQEPLRKALRGALKEAGKRGRVGMIEVPCFGVCPKQAVTVAIGSAPGALLVVPAGFDVRNLAGRTRNEMKKDVLF